MKFELNEYGSCFGFEMIAETAADAAKIARLKINGTKEVRGIYANAGKDGTFSGTVVIGKARNEKSDLK